MAALAAYAPLLEADDAASAPAVAELSAFAGDWSTVPRTARMHLLAPLSVYAGNVTNDMVRLLGLAGHELGEWDEIGEAAAATVDALRRSDHPDHIRSRLGTIFDGLASYADRRGAPPHELIRVFGGASPAPSREAFESAVEAAPRNRPKLVGDPEGMARFLMSLAISYRQPGELLKLHRANREFLDWELAVEIARAFVAAGEPDAAWAVVESQLPHWYPVDRAQVAPVVLLTVGALRGLMSAERRRAVLTTPRAGHAD